MSASRVWVLGRRLDCDMIIDDAYASDVHCEVEMIGSLGARTEFRVRDMGSTNGTNVHRGQANVRVTGWFYLAPDDVLIIGRTRVTVDDLRQMAFQAPGAA